GEDVDRADADVGVGGDGGDQPIQSRDDRLGGRAGEQVGRVLQDAFEGLLQAQRQVELGGAGGEGGGGGGGGGEGGGGAGRVRWAWGLFWKASMTWNSGWRAMLRGGLRISTRRSKGRSWCW